MISHNETELIALGKQLGKLLEKQDVIILSGDLGAGKTTFTKGIAKGLGIDQMIKSPTYTIVREYEGRLPLYHLDVYRIGNDPDSIDLDDFLFGDGATIIEWGELIEPSLSDAYLKIFIVVQKAYWNQGLGQILLEEGIEWAHSTGVLRKLVLNVQVRNERAVHLYKKLGFEIEGCQARGACSAEGEFLDVYLMGKLID